MATAGGASNKSVFVPSSQALRLGFLHRNPIPRHPATQLLTHELIRSKKTKGKLGARKKKATDRVI